MKQTLESNVKAPGRLPIKAMSSLPSAGSGSSRNLAKRRCDGGKEGAGHDQDLTLSGFGEGGGGEASSSVMNGGGEENGQR